MTASTVEAGTALCVAFEDSPVDDPATLGGKGAGLVRMTRSGFPVPPGYVVSTEWCHRYQAERRLPDALTDAVLAALEALEARAGKVFGGGPEPLLLSVRSGAPVSMPGMMDTVLNLGLNREAALALAAATGNPRFVGDVLFRFHGMYADIVQGVIEVPERDELEPVLDALPAGADGGAVYDAVWAFCQERLEQAGEDPLPDDPRTQLLGAIAAVFDSWNTRRAITYRELHGIPHAMGTAVVVQSMVFGNLDQRSGSGVVFTRNPMTGEPGLYGEFLPASQGEDVVAGTRTPLPIAQIDSNVPGVHAELVQVGERLEAMYRDALDIEFTAERGTLYILQVRAAKRTAPAAIRIAVDLIDEGIPAEVALRTVTPEQIRQVQQPEFEQDALEEARSSGRLLATGIGACPGQVSGMLALTPEQAEVFARAGEQVILARRITSPTDLHGMIASAGVLTVTGGATSHAAVVARALGRPCIVGCADLTIDQGSVTLAGNGTLLREGDLVSIDGATGEVFAGGIPAGRPAATGATLDRLAAICRTTAEVELSCRATTVEQIGRATAAGVSGILTAAADVLAMHPRFSEVLGEIRDADASAGSCKALEDVLAEGFAPLLAAAGEIEFGVRAIDFLVDETSELLDSAAFAVEHPRLSMPLGSAELVRAHIRGLQRAAQAAGRTAPVQLSVRNLSDPLEAAALRKLTDEEGSGAVEPGMYVSSPRGAVGIEALTSDVPVAWVELRLLQAAVFGLRPKHLLTGEPIDGYLKDGLLSEDPRTGVAAAVLPLLGATGTASASGARVGVRVSGDVAEDTVAVLLRLGVRRFAVDLDETYPAWVALGRAATA